MIEAKEGHIPKHYLLVDVYKDKEWILRQKLELGFYWRSGSPTSWIWTMMGRRNW